MEFAKSLNEEERRTIAEELSEEELAVFDLLTKPEIDLTKSERKQVKKVARELLAVLKREKASTGRRNRQQSRTEALAAPEPCASLQATRWVLAFEPTH